MDASITKTTKNGKTAIITRTGIYCTVYLDGELYITNGFSRNVENTSFSTKTGAAYVIDSARLPNGKIRQFGLTFVEALELGLYEAWENESQEREGDMSLSKQRNQLNEAFWSAIDTLKDLGDKAVESDDGNWDYALVDRAEEIAQDAREALKKFDDSHPEILGEIERQNKVELHRIVNNLD